MVDASEAFKEQLAKLRKAYSQQLPEKLAEIQQAWDALRAGAWDREQLTLLRRLVHGVTGSGATFGFKELSQQARAVEDTLSDLLDDKLRPDDAVRARISEGLAELQAVGATSVGSAAADVSIEAPHHVVSPSAKGGAEPPALTSPVYILEDEPLLARNLAQQIAHFAYDVHVFETSEALLAAARDRLPAVAMLDIILPEGELAGIDVARRLGELAGEPMPTVFISSRTDVEARLEAVRVGGQAYLSKPVAPSQVIDVLDRLTDRHVREPFRVLVVEDDPAEAALYTQLLGDAGFVTRTVDGTGAIMAGLVDFRPDIILMDFYLTDCSGPELSRMIRQQEAYVGIPIIFVSAELDEDKHLLAIQAGADDFLTKPVRLDHLVASVRARAERSRHLGGFLARDSLTGALNHTALKTQLESEVARARRTSSIVSYAMIDIDRFKDVNDTWGHASGDRVLKSLAHLLLRRLRQSDTIGRYGGEEFGIILPGADGRQAMGVLDEIRSRFARLKHKVGEQTFEVTFSGGIATYPGQANASRMSDAADAALYEAKRKGRNRLVLAG